MNLMADPITEKLEKFILDQGNEVLIDAFNEGLPQRSILHYPWLDMLNDDYDKVNKLNDQLIWKINEICVQHIFWRFLIIFRKLPTLSFNIIKQVILKESKFDSISAVFQESILFGTNCIFKYSQNDLNLTHCNNCYNFLPTKKEFEDALRIMVFSLLHRQNMFYLNSISRRELTNEISLPTLLEIYNRRHELRRKISTNKDLSKDAIIIPVFLGNVPLQKRTINYKNYKGTECSVFLRNYSPLPIEIEKEFKTFEFLDNEDFIKIVGLTFQNWYKIWVGFNTVLKHNLITLWQDSYIYSTGEEQMHAAAERADNYGDTALGCGVDSSIVQTCHLLLTRKYRNSAPTLNECNIFFNYLKYDRLLGDPRFTEQPILFYNVGSNRVFWDHLRHGGLVRAVARNLYKSIRPGKKIKGKTGYKFEEYIKNQILKIINGAIDVKTNIKIKSKPKEKHIWEIDVGFIYQKILFLIEAKHRYKSLKYHFADGPSVSSRVQEIENILEKQDHNLKKYHQQVFEIWKFSEIIGAICIVCTEEVEYISSFEKKWWLKSAEYPRICLLNEILKFLSSENLEQLHYHPNFVKLIK